MVLLGMLMNQQYELDEALVSRDSQKLMRLNIDRLIGTLTLIRSSQEPNPVFVLGVKVC